jgi:O-antigen/teichoic acid export membrane protein
MLPRFKIIIPLQSIFAIMGIVQRDSLRISLIAYFGAAIGYLNKVFLFPNFLETEEVGLANLLITIAVIYSQLSTLGSHNIVSRFFPFFKDREQQHHGFLFGVSALALAGFILFTTVFFLIQQPFRYYYLESSPLLVEYAFYIIPLALATLFFNLYDTYLRSLYKNIIPSVIHEIGLRILITLAIFTYALGWLSFPWFVALYVAVNCLPAVIVILYTWYIRQLFLKPKISPLWRRTGKLILVYGLFSFLNNLSFIILSSVDSLMVASFIDLGAAGVYTTMVFITTVFLIPYRSMIKVTTPLVAQQWKDRELGKMESLYQRASEGSLVVGAGLFLILWINIDSVFYFMPQEYALGRWVFLVLAIGRLFDMTSGLNGVILLTSRKYRYDLLFTAGLVTFAVISNYFLIPLWGMNGAAVASMISILLFNLLRVIFVKMHFRIQPFSLKMLWVPFLAFVIIILSGSIPLIANVYLDVIVRSVFAGLAFMIPVYLLKISDDINHFIEKYLELLRNFKR